MLRPVDVFAFCTLFSPLVFASGGCADEFGVAGEDADALPLMRSLEPEDFGRAVTLTLRDDGGWIATGIVPPAGVPVRIWIDEPHGDVERVGGELSRSFAPGAVLLRQGGRVWSADRGLALYSTSDEELWIGVNAEQGERSLGPIESEVTIAWGAPVVAHATGLDVLAAVGTGEPLQPWPLPADGAFADVGEFEAGARLRVVAERTRDAQLPAVIDGEPGSEPGPHPGPMARLLPGEPAPTLRFPGLWSEGIAYRIDGVLVGHLPVGGVVHLPEGGRLSLAANGGSDPSAALDDVLVVGLEALPRLGVEAGTLPWSAFADARVGVEVTVESSWTSTGIEVARGDLLRVEGRGTWRDVPADPLVPPRADDGVDELWTDVGPDGLLVRAPLGGDWLVPGSRILAPHVRIGEHVMAVPGGGVFVAPTDGMLQVAANGCGPGGPGACDQALAESGGTVRFTVGWVRALVVPEVD